VSETNNYGFDVQKADGSTSSYQTIANSFVAGHGTTLQPQTYRFVDVNVGPGTWFYRLKQTDLSGAIHYSEGVSPVVLPGLEDAPLPTSFSIDQNFPNPFNPSTIIRYALPQNAVVRLTVFNALGQQVMQLVNGEEEAGYHQVKFDGSRLASGVFFYRIEAGAFSQSKKLLLLR
jgi:hypothetical protein